MALVALWNSDRSQVTEKRIEQLIASAGEGRLRDGNNTSQELRRLIAVLPSDLIEQWISDCLANRFTDFGFVLQDIINEVGRRLDFHVTHGVYRCHGNKGYDGLWRMPDGRASSTANSTTNGTGSRPSDLVWPKDKSLEDSEHLLHPDVLAQEIVDDMQTALDQFAAIAEELKE